MKLIDATNLKLGRLASYAAKQALNGEEIAVVNAERAVITGRKKDILSKYQKRRTIGSRYKGPFFPRVPNLIVRRTIRGMLSYKKGRGAQAYKRVKVYIGVPAQFKENQLEKVEGAQLGKIAKRNYLSVAELSKNLGYRS